MNEIDKRWAAIEKSLKPVCTEYRIARYKDCYYIGAQDALEISALHAKELHEGCKVILKDSLENLTEMQEANERGEDTGDTSS